MVTAVNTKVLHTRRSRPPHHPDKRYRRSIPGGILARLIPPLIKRARILVDCVVAIVTSVKFYRKENLWLSDVWLRHLWLRALPEYSRFPTSSD